MNKFKKTDDEKTELEQLRAIADDLGISYPNNIGTLSLSDKIEKAKKEQNKTKSAKPRKLSNKEEKILRASDLSKVQIAVMDPNLSADTTAFCSCHNMILDLARYAPLNMEIALEESLIQDLENRRFVASQPQIVDGRPTGNTVAKEMKTYSVSRLT